MSVNKAAFQGLPSWSEEVTWVELDSNLEISYLRSVLLSPPSRVPTYPSSQSASTRNAPIIDSTVTSSKPASQNYQTPIQPESTIKSFFAGLFASSVKVGDLATFENLVGSTKGRRFEYQPGQVLNIITLLDTGGQPQYIHLLPTINIYPTVTFVVHNLSKKLDETSAGGIQSNAVNSFLPHIIYPTPTWI